MSSSSLGSFHVELRSHFFLHHTKLFQQLQRDQDGVIVNLNELSQGRRHLSPGPQLRQQPQETDHSNVFSWRRSVCFEYADYFSFVKCPPQATQDQLHCLIFLHPCSSYEFQLIGKLLMTRSLQFGIDVADARVDLCNLRNFPCRRRRRSTGLRTCTSVTWITQQHMCFIRETPLNPHMLHVFSVV